MIRLNIAPKREARTEVGTNWFGGIVSTQGVRICGVPSALRVQVDATAEAEAEIRRLLGPRFHIERLVEHFPTTGSAPAD